MFALASLAFPITSARLGDDEAVSAPPSPPQDEEQPSTACLDPVASVIEILQCVADEDATCAGNGYNKGAFKKLHNGVDTNTNISFGFWTGAFLLLDFQIEVNHAFQFGDNQVSVRYIETVITTDGSDLFLDPSDTYPFSQAFDQHEHALVTVDDDCRIVMWDQYGDNKEQTDVEDAVDVIVCELNPLCGFFGV